MINITIKSDQGKILDKTRCWKTELFPFTLHFVYFNVTVKSRTEVTTKLKFKLSN